MYNTPEELTMICTIEPSQKPQATDNKYSADFELARQYGAR
jgi:hypothetical protein